MVGAVALAHAGGACSTEAGRWWGQSAGSLRWGLLRWLTQVVGAVALAQIIAKAAPAPSMYPFTRFTTPPPTHTPRHTPQLPPNTVRITSSPPPPLCAPPVCPPRSCLSSVSCSPVCPPRSLTSVFRELPSCTSDPAPPPLQPLDPHDSAPNLGSMPLQVLPHILAHLSTAELRNLSSTCRCGAGRGRSG